jgi:hypothetical protein
MRGDTKAVLLDTGSGQAYVTKLVGNPFGRRVLANEWIGTILMRHLGLPIPDIALIAIDSDLRDLPAGIHFGSRYPGDPSTTSVYDFLPDRLLARLVDDRDLFTGVIVFDLWTANTDFRQAIFHRPLSVHDLKQELQTLFIDNSHLFGGPDWTFKGSTRTGHYFSRTQHKHICDWSAFSPWLKRLEQLINYDLVRQAMNSVPVEWLTAGDFQGLRQVHNELVARSLLIGEFISAHIRTNPDLFPNWCGGDLTTPTHRYPNCSDASQLLDVCTPTGFEREVLIK